MKAIVEGNYGTMYYVNDMAKAVKYYQENLGLKARFESAEWSEFDLGDDTALCLHHAGAGVKPLSTGGILIIKIKDIKNVVTMLKNQGVEFIKDVSEVHPGAYSADFKDPSNNVVALYEDTNN